MQPFVASMNKRLPVKKTNRLKRATGIVRSINQSPKSPPISNVEDCLQLLSVAPNAVKCTKHSCQILCVVRTHMNEPTTLG